MASTSTMRRLSDEDVRAIFESLHGTHLPPPHLKFHIVPVGADGLKLSPPSYEFEDGLYVLLRPEKRRKHHGSAAEALRARGKNTGGNVPSHLKHWVMMDVPPETCPWSLSGPQFPQPTAIQQRYCYPKGDPDYAGRKGGALWTMYGRDGKEDFEFRLLHVYFSAKRAINKGVTLSEEDRLKQHLQVESANAAAASIAGTPKRTAKRVSRAVRSPWQERAENRAAGGKRKLFEESVSPRETATKWPRHSSSPVSDGRTTLLPPPSPFQTRRMTMFDREGGSIFVSPSTTASPTDEAGPLGNQFDHVMFDHPPFHMVPSFEMEDHVKAETDSSKNPCPFRGKTGRLQMEFCLPGGGRALIEGGDSFAFNDADATEIGGNVEDSWNDPLLPLSVKGSFDDSEQKKATFVASSIRARSHDFCGKLKVSTGLRARTNPIGDSGPSSV